MPEKSVKKTNVILSLCSLLYHKKLCKQKEETLRETKKKYILCFSPINKFDYLIVSPIYTVMYN